MRGLAFHQLRPRKLVVLRRGISRGQRFLDHRLDNDAVFGMQVHHTAVIAHLAHRSVDVGVVDHQHVRIGHVQLDARYAVVVDEIGQLGKRGRVDVSKDRVEAEIDDTLRFGRLESPVECRFRGFAAELLGEIDVRRSAAECRRHCTRLEGVAGFHAVSHRRLHVHVDIDATRHNQQPGGIVNLGVIGGQCPADGLDAAILEQDVANVVVHRGNDPAAADQGPLHLALRSVPQPGLVGILAGSDGTGHATATHTGLTQPEVGD